MNNSEIEAAPWEEREKQPGFSWDQWRERISIMAGMLDADISSVLDLGAGGMLLKEYLPQSVAYYPVDYTSRSDKTIVCDFNQHQFPDFQADAVFVSGCLEYVNDTEWFFEKIKSATNKNLIISYSILDQIPDIQYRRSRAWVNDLTFLQLINELQKNDFILVDWNHRYSFSPLLKFKKAIPQSLSEYYFCTGCGACHSICPVDAITMCLNQDGFLKPNVDDTKCINCNQCISICPSLHPDSKNSINPPCYALAEQDEVRQKSSSGGIFTVLAEEVFQKGGAVFGAAWADDFSVQHIGITEISQLDKLRHSKYLQSNTDNSFKQVKELLGRGTTVLYSGCPCQISGLKAFLKNDYSNLFTIDLLCHYVPSPLHFKKYLRDTFGESNVVSYDFRVKNTGWSADTHRVLLKDSKELIRHYNDDAYQQSFHPRLLMNPSCENCRFCGFPRAGDISIGDFHGIAEHDSALDDTKGTSILLVNNPKGEQLLNIIKAKSKFCKEVPLEWGMNNRLSDKFPAHPARDRFYDLIKYKTFPKAVEYSLNFQYDVGIVGIWSVENYGSNMTYYALYQTIRDLGLEPLMIERPMDSSWRPHDYPIGFRKNPYRQFDLARIYSNKAEMRELNQKCKEFLVGSDQLFNDDLYHRFGEYITLDWVSDRKKKSAYAASFGREYFWGIDETRATMSYFIKKFDNFSVREESGVKLLKSAFGKEAQLVLDPVFLCDRKHYIKMASEGKSFGAPHIAAYILDPDSCKKKIVERIEGYLSLPCNIYTDSHYTWVSKEEKIEEVWKRSHSKNIFNEDWLRNIAESDFVVADSFHGICFAIIFEKPFIAIGNPGRGMERFRSLLRLFGLEYRLVTCEEGLDQILCKSIDYTAVTKTLDTEKEKSISWLKHAVTISSNLKSISTYDLLAQQKIDVDLFVNQVNQRFTGVDQFANYTEQRFSNADEFVKRVDQTVETVLTREQQNEQRLIMVEQQIQALLHSRSYRLGRLLTFIPRKLKSKIQGMFRK